MKSLSLTDKEARDFYATGNEALKSKLAETFGSGFFSQKITDRIGDFNDILAISGRTMESIARDGDTPDEVAYKQAKLIAEVYNEGTVLDPNNKNQYKYYPWFEITPGSGFGLSFYGYDCWLSGAGRRRPPLLQIA